MKTPILAAFLFFTGTLYAQSDARETILKRMNLQEKAWNTGNLEAFMEPYWKNDSLMFIGKSGITYGWQKTLDNYKRGYPDATAMGKLKFDILQTKKIATDSYFVVGKWHLTRSAGDLSGHFTLLFRKINGEWVIVADHSS